MATAVQFTDPATYHGEGAVWAEAWGGLRCVDMFAGDVLEIDASGALTRHHLGSVAAMIRPIDEQRSIVALERDIIVWNSSTGERQTLATDVVATGARLNEGGCTPDGDLLIGSLAYGFTPGGGLLARLGATGAVTTVLPSVSISNGLGFSPDGTRMYYNDSASGRVDRFTVTDSGELIERRPLATIAEGGPDGLWVDELGGVWVAVYGGGCVRRFLPDGTPDEVVSVGARQVTSCTFGGPDLSTLFITTSRENLADDDDPLAGSIFSASVGVRGLAVLPFRAA